MTLDKCRLTDTAVAHQNELEFGSFAGSLRSLIFVIIASKGQRDRSRKRNRKEQGSKRTFGIEQEKKNDKKVRRGPIVTGK